MAEVNLRKLRQIVYGCLGEHKLENKISLKLIRFGGRGFGRIIVIKEWDRSADGHKWQSLKRMIRERTRKLYGRLPSWTLIMEAEYKKEEWKMPESGWGNFQDYFDSCYDDASGVLLEKDPNMADDERIAQACDIAAKETIKHIEGRGFKVVEQ